MPGEGKVKVPVRGRTLAWAMRRAGLEAPTLARGLGVRPERVEAWLAGEDSPTYAQALKLAQKLHVGLPHLLLPPPEVHLPVRDFRRGAFFGQEPSPELLEALYDALRKRDWMRERRQERLPFVGAGQGKEAPQVGRAMREALGLESLQARTRRAEDFLKGMAERAEELGVLVLRQGHVGTNTRRVYSSQEFSGFSLPDPVAPVVFVNAQDHPLRQVFTLAHELAHIWLGEEGLDGGLEDGEPQERVEAWADEAAAEALMPAETFQEAWQADLPPLEAASEATRRFKVSRMAALRRARGLGLLPWFEYTEAVETLKRTGEEKPRQAKGGGDFWKSLSVGNSPRFVEEVRRAALEGEIDLKEVATLLNLSLPTALAFLERGGG